MSDVEISNLTDSSAVPQPTQLLPEAIFTPVIRTIAAVSLAAASLGTVTNTLNLVVFYRIGLSTTTYICFFLLALVDLISCIYILVKASVRLPIYEDNFLLSLEHVAFIFVPVAFSAYAFGSYVTMVINLERSCSVVFPMKVKRIFTKGFVLSLLFGMFVYQVATATPRFFSFQIIAASNTSKYRFAVDVRNMDTELSLLSLNMSFTGPTIACFFLVILGTIFLIINFRRSSRQREKMTGKTSEESSTKEARIIKSVILICCLYIGGFSASVIQFFVTTIYPDLNFRNPYLSNIDLICVDFSFFTQTLSCSVNIFVYVRMNSKYRDTLKDMFSTLQEKNDTP